MDKTGETGETKDAEDRLVPYAGTNRIRSAGVSQPSPAYAEAPRQD